MKFAFSTLACPTWDFETVAAKAREFGYEGVELRGFLNEAELTASNIFLSDARKVRRVFEEAGVDIACLSSSIAYTGRKKEDRRMADDLLRFIDAAHALDCGLVKIADTQVRPGGTRADSAAGMARWVLPLADAAAERGVLIVIENLLSFRNAKELWLVLEMISHPAVAACWDVLNAALIGEVPSVSVPTLNSRIQYVQVKDASLGPLGATYTKLGAGNVKLQDLLRRLMGIGYDGWVCFEWEKAWLPNLAGEADEMLPDAVKKLREWTKPPAEEEPAGGKADAHGAKKPAGATAAAAK